MPAELGAKLLKLPTETGPERELVLAAHQALATANPANAARFKDVLEYLQGGEPDHS